MRECMQDFPGQAWQTSKCDIWGKMNFGIIVRDTLSALIWYQNQVHTPPTIEIWQSWPFVYKTVVGFYGSVIVRLKIGL